MGMLPVDDIRLANLASLIDRHGGQRQLAERLDKAPAQISQWMTRAPNSKTGKPRAMRSDTAREIEERLELPRGWMDQDHSERPVGSRPIAEWDGESQLPDTHQAMQRIEVYLSAGNGCSIAEAEPPTYLTPNVFRADFMRSAGWSSKTHFSMYVRGDSMEPTIPDGSTVVVDVTDQDPKGTKSQVFAIMVDGEPRLKRLLKLPTGAVRVSSDNPSPNYPAFDVGPDSRKDLKVIGRVVYMQTKLD
jgi:phage repressor protein C with HTH and peptisase S24 domain